MLAPDDIYCHLKFYDWLLILPQEVQYIWRASWNYTKILYLLMRYIPFVSMSLLVRSEFLMYDLPYDDPSKAIRSHSITFVVAVQLSFINLPRALFFRSALPNHLHQFV